MRGGVNIAEVDLMVGEKPVEIVGFWITEENYIYVKTHRDGHYTNYRLTKLDDCFKIIRKENAIRQNVRELSVRER
jgi:hypothetical protein